MKPTKECWMGDYLMIPDWREDIITESKHILHRYFLELKSKHVHKEKNSWCEFLDYEIIERSPCGGDPLCQMGTIGIKWKVEGRAFYIKRAFRGVPQRPRHSLKKKVPKKKRGKEVYASG